MIRLKQLLWAAWTILLPGTWKALGKAVALSLPREEHLREKLLLIMVGYSGSGKSTFIERHPKARQMAVISSIRIHDKLNELIPQLRDDKSTKGYAYITRQLLTWVVRRRLLKLYFAEGAAVVSDSCNLRRADRRYWIRMARKWDYRVVEVHVVRRRTEILAVLQSRGYEDLFETQERLMQAPHAGDEGVPVLRHYAGKSNPHDIAL
jgi:predicted kinase